MKKLYALVLAFALIWGVSHAQTMFIDEVFTDVDITADVQYGTGLTEGGQTVDLSLDIYTPAGDSRTNRPLLIMAHQGSFIPEYGDKSDAYLVDYAMAMAKRGYVVANINYREGWGFSPLNTEEQNAREIIPAAWRGIQDFKTAVRFFRSSIAQGNPYGIQSDKIIGGGFGAGGYLPLNAQTIDVPMEIELPELQQKDVFGNPNGNPYIDTNLADLGGIYATSGGHPGYDFRLPVVVNISGAVPTLKTLEIGQNPLVISCHSTEDQATPYRTDVVFAAGVFPVIEVSGSYSIHKALDDMNQNQDWKMEDRDGYSQVRIPEDTPEDNMYKNGLLSFVGEGYMWSVNDEDTYSPNYQDAFTEYMDSVVTFTAYRLERWISDNFSSVKELNDNRGQFKVYPNPVRDKAVFINTANTTPEKLLIRDIAGKTAKELPLNSNRVELDLSGLKPGAYLINVHYGDRILIDRLVKY